MTTMRESKQLLLLLVLLVFKGSFFFWAFAENVTYDSRALVIDGVRRVIISGSIHYPRSTPDMWPDLIEKSKAGGLNVIETYVFWNIHEPVRGQYDFEGRKDLVRFVKTVAQAGLFVHLRIGPYVCAEWNYGGFPLWLHFIPGIVFRTDNEPFKKEMQRFTAKIVGLMQQENLYHPQGGPIILDQIENEYGNIDSAYGPAAKSYISWAASMAISLETGVPWVMCQQPDAPDPIINTCNGFYCDQFSPNSNKKPKIWTEDWSGWFIDFGGAVPTRPVQDLAFAVARFYERGGTFQNYYMYHGGTNFGRTSGGPFIATSYDYDAPIDEYGLIRQPKWGHLKDLHEAIILCEGALVSTTPTYIYLGPNLEGHVYNTSSGCAAFLANFGTQSDSTVTFRGNSYHLPAWSVSILPDCLNVVFNTAQINAQTSVTVTRSQTTAEQALGEASQNAESAWSYVIEPVGISKSNAFTNAGLLEQINTTADSSDYLWYSIGIEISGNEAFLFNGTQSTLHVESLGHVLHAFLNGEISGSGFGNSEDAKVTLQIPVTLLKGNNTIDLLSATVGLQNYGAFFDLKGAGVTGPVKLVGRNSSVDLSSEYWAYQVGLKGEELGFYENTGASAQWVSSSLPINQPLIWYKTTFDPPAGNDPIAIDFTGMGKGEAWVNGESIGRYWPTNIASQSGCTASCDYRGNFESNKCLTKCGQPTQQLYHLPRSLIQSGGSNTLVLFEEFGGDPTGISFVTRQAGSICAHISQIHPPPVNAWSSGANTGEKGPELQLECPNPNQVISSIDFASFGTPFGACRNFSQGQCNSASSLSIVQKACLGSNNCSIPVSSAVFGELCQGVLKSLAVQATCS